MKTITKEWLNKKNACANGIKWFLGQDERNTAKVMLKLVDEDRGRDALWVLEHIMNKKQSVGLAIFSARLCLDIFEKEYPEDDRPRKAIEAAEAYLKNPCEKTKSAARSAAGSAADAAARSAAEYAARYAAGSAADAAWSAARSAADAAWYAAGSAARSAAGSADSAARSARSAAGSAAKIAKKIIEEAIRIIGL